MGASLPLLAPAYRPPARERLLASFVIAFALVLFNSGVAVYLCWGDPLAVACILVSALALVLLFAQHLVREEPEHSARKRSVQLLLKAGVACLTALLLSMIAYKLVRTAPPSTRPLLWAWAAAGVTVLGVGGYSAVLLHRRSWSKQPCQDVVFSERSQDVVFPLVKHLP